MKVVVFGASGRVGSIIVEMLVAAKYDVVAVARTSTMYQNRTDIKPVALDVHDQDAVAQALGGADIVLSCLSSWGSDEGDVLTAAMRALVPAMERSGIQRVVSLTGNSAFTREDKPKGLQKLNRAMLSRIAPKVLWDGEEHMVVLEDSTLDWTVLRAPVMNELGGRGYALRDTLSGATATIHRGAVARAMVDQMTDRSWIRQAPCIWRV